MKFSAWLALVCFGMLSATAQDYNTQGSDPRVDYNKLFQDSTAATIPWDDRNLQLTADKLAKLPPDDFQDRQNIPLFYRVIMRERFPGLRKIGLAQYPRAGAERFEQEYGGILRDGKFEEKESHKRGGTIELGQEANISDPFQAAETAIAIHPIDPSIVIAGANSRGGQAHYYSTDGGVTWNPSPGADPLPNTCCDPTLAWSPDGVFAYAATLGDGSGVWFYRSSDNGVNWTRTLQVSTTGADDKEYMHVDTYNCGTNPHCGNIYISWHRNNVMLLARSTDNGDSFTTYTHADSSSAIGSDVTSDANGNVHHFWPETNGRILISTSTDGGVSFSPKRVIANTNGRFIYPVPAMDIREVFIHVSTAVDLTGGKHHNRMYVCYNDIDNATSSNNPVENHSKIIVGYSDDGGVTWTYTNPHETDDIQTVDRFHPWIEIDGFGNVHTIFYDTRNDANRRNPDIYHSFSSDGGATWSDPVRVTSVSSQYLTGFQYGDYNGMAIMSDQVRGIWTDNRPGSGTRAFSREMQVLGQQSEDFSLSASGDTQPYICSNRSISPITISVTGVNAFNAPVDFQFEPNPLPTGFTGTITGSPVSPPGEIIVELSANSSAPAGPTPIRVVGTSGSFVHDITVTVNVLPALNDGLPLWFRSEAYDPIADPDRNNRVDILDLLIMNCEK